MQEVSQQNIIKIKETLSQTRVNRFEVDSIVDAVLADKDIFPSLYETTNSLGTLGGHVSTLPAATRISFLF